MIIMSKKNALEKDRDSGKRRAEGAYIKTADR